MLLTHRPDHVGSMVIVRPAQPTDPDDATRGGWDAIDAALERIYPGVTPRHLGTLIKFWMGGPDPLDGISIYERADHWHFVSYGLSELDDKESDNAGVSGWGFELTFRVARAAGEPEPPGVGGELMQNLARYVVNTGNAFAPGHHVDLNGPIALNHADTRIRAVTFAEDPELPDIDTPNGRLAFLQIVGITLDEYAAVESWSGTAFVEVLREVAPLLVTDLSRASILDDPAVAERVHGAIGREGSATGALFVEEASWQLGPLGTVLVFGANPAERIGRTLRGRLGHGRSLEISMASGGVRLRPGEAYAVAVVGDGYVELTLPPEAVDELASALRPAAGEYPLRTVKGLTVQIVTSQILDGDGNVVRTIG